MGSLTSTPKVANAPTQTTHTSAVTTEVEEEVQTQELESEERKKGLLARDRSRIGTINTTLKGVLTNADEDRERKTLLGQ